MSTEAENAGEAAVRAPQREYGGILSPPAVACLRLWQTQRRRDHLGGAIEALADSHEALRAERDVAHAAASRFAAEGCVAQANCLAVEAERDACDAAWRALVGRMMQYTWHWPVCERDVTSVCTCGLVEVRAQVQVALADAPPQAMPDYTNHAPGCPMRTSGGILPGCSCGALTDTPPAPRGAAE
jgi:hypothetical protein